MIVWQPALPPWLLAGLILGCAAGLGWLWRRLHRRHGVVAWRLWWPKAVLAALMLVALLNPALPGQRDGTRPTLWLVVDRSGSMARPDAPSGTRLQRAERLATRLAEAATAAGARVERRWCDDQLVASPDAAPGPGGVTDLPAALRALTASSGGEAAGVVLLSDGGDEPGLAACDGLPAAPIATVAIGGDPERVDSVGILAVAAPESAEPSTALALQATLSARGGAVFRSTCAAVPVVLERREADGRWTTVAQATADLRNGRAGCDLRLDSGLPGTLVLRLRVVPPAGDHDALDDQRPLLIPVRERRIRVLYLTLQPGVEIKHLREALARDPGLSLSAVYRTLGDRWGVQSDDPDRAAVSELSGGLPADLSRWDVVILGAFPASGLPPADQQRLATWVTAGGGLGVLGGDRAFGAGGWSASPLAPALPWAVREDEAAPERGSFPVAVLPSPMPVVAGVGEALGGGGTVASLNRPGPLRPGASVLLTARAGGADLPLVVSQSWGSGRVLALASDSWWRLPREASGLLWRNGVRWLVGTSDGSGLLRVGWDRARYRPGETAQAVLRCTRSGGAAPAISGSVRGPDGSVRALSPSAAGDGSWSLTVALPRRGTWRIHLAATAEGKELATYDRSIEVERLLPEGARPGRDDAGLAALARAHGGVACGEEDVAPLLAWIEERCRPTGGSTAQSVVFNGWWWPAAALAALLAEWWQRRRSGVI